MHIHLEAVPIPLWMSVTTGATAAMVPMVMIMILWLRQDMNTMNARMSRMETTIREDIKEVKDDLKDLNRKVDRLIDSLRHGAVTTQ